MSRSTFVLRIATVFGLSIGATHAGTPYYVDNCGHDTACNGTTTACYNGGAGAPNCAKKTIQAGINATQANGDEVVVANGTYTGSVSETQRNKNMRFTKWGNGDPRLITVRSANGAANCIIDMEGAGFAFDFDLSDVGQITREAIVGTPVESLGVANGKGFTIRNGDSTTSGGIYIADTSPTIRDCIFEDNDGGSYGGGIDIIKTTDFRIEGCIFEGNTASNGGAISMRFVSSGEELEGTIEDCTFTENEASLGGAIYAEGVNRVILNDCRIDSNIANFGGGGIYVKHPTGGLKIVNSRITRNNATLGSPPKGGGLYFEGPGTGVITPEMMNCIISGNKASSGGGLYSSGFSQMAVANSVFYQNTATDTTFYGHAIWHDTTTVLNPKANIANSIIWHSSVPSGVLVRGANSALRIEESNLRQTTLTGLETSDLINNDPDFVDADGTDNIVGTADDNYRLLSTSPCIEEGDSALRRADYADLNGNDDDEEPTPLDLDLKPRVIGSGCLVDMGAYEYLHGGCPTSDGNSASPPDGTQDARRPHPKGTHGTAVSLGSREGIGSSTEPITISLTNDSNPVCGATDPACWELCETGLETVESPTSTPPENDIATIEEVDDGEYEIVLDRPISGGHYTAIEYAGGGMVMYASLPGDVNLNGKVTGIDILDFIDCCYNDICSGFDDYTCDLNRSGGPPYDDDNDADYNTMLDLVNGYGNFIPWFNEELPEENECEGESLMGGGSGGGEELTNSDFTDWFVNFISAADPLDSQAEDRFNLIVISLTQWCLEQYSSEELADLVDALSDPELDFASSAGQNAAAVVLESISQ